jgi:acyl carrier protein phosphodiesterase
MNYLAHILLSGPDPDWQLGGFLGDFVKGPLPPTSLSSVSTANSGLVDSQGRPWESGVVAGIQLHRQLDAYVDLAPEYVACLELLGRPYRRVGGIALDVFFDHLLVRNWSQFSSIALPDFSRGFYDLCARQQQRLPVSAANFMSRAAEHDLFQGYGRQSLYLPVLERIDERIRFETNLLAAGEAVLQRSTELEQRFLQWMPQLLTKAAELRAGGLTESR